MEISKTSGIYSFFVLGSGNVASTLISAVAIILLSRYLGPSEFGVFSAAFATLQIMVRLADLGFNTAAEREIARTHHQDETYAQGVMRFVFWFKIILFALIFALGYFLAPILSSQIFRTEDPSLLRLTLFLSFGTILFEYGTLIFQATQRFGLVARMAIVQAIGKLGATVLLLSYGTLSALSGLLIYALMPVFGLFSAFFSSPITIFSRQLAWRRYLPSLFRVAKWTGLATLSATLADNLDILIVQSFLDNFQTGLWGGATRIAAFISVFGWSMGSVISNRVARYKDPINLRSYLRKSWKISLASFALLLLALPFASLAITLTIGSAYASITPVLQVLMISSALSAAITPFSSLFYLFDRPQYYALSGVLQTTILLLGDFFAIPLYGLMGAAVVRVVVKLATLIFTLSYARLAYQEKYG